MSKRNPGAEAEAVLSAATGVTSAVSPSRTRGLAGRMRRVISALLLFGTTKNHMHRQALKETGERITGQCATSELGAGFS